MEELRELSIGHLLGASLIVLGLQSIALTVYLIAKKKLSSSRFLRFIGILGIGMAASLFPMGFMGMIFGFPAVLLSAILVSLFLDKETTAVVAVEKEVRE